MWWFGETHAFVKASCMDCMFQVKVDWVLSAMFMHVVTSCKRVWPSGKESWKANWGRPKLVGYAILMKSTGPTCTSNLMCLCFISHEGYPALPFGVASFPFCWLVDVRNRFALGPLDWVAWRWGYRISC